MVRKLDQDVSEREALKTKSIFINNKIQDQPINPMDEFTVDHLIQMAQTLTDDATEIHIRIMAHSPENVSEHNQAYHSLLEESLLLQRQLHGIKISFPAKQATTTQPHSSSADIRLPKLELPTFDGNLSNWVAFRDMFTNTIHNNKALSKAQKLTYLKASLKGEAERQIQTIIITDTNYDIAWEQITTRYQNDREILFAIFRKFIDQPTVVGNSSTLIRTLIDTSTECMRSLEVLQLKIDPAMDAFMLFHIFNKLDKISKQLWEQALVDSKIPKTDTLFTFLEQRARALATSEPQPQNNTRQQFGANDRRPRTHHSQQARVLQCKSCNSTEHNISQCPTFLSKSPKERQETIKQLKLCLNCMRGGHTASTCSNPGRCFTCKGKHHTKIHINNNVPPPLDTSKLSQQPNTLHTNDGLSNTMLATAIVRIKDSFGQQQYCRALLDGGSTVSFISESCAQRLRLKRDKNSIEILGIASTPAGTTKGCTSITITPHFPSTAAYTTDAFIINKITGQQPVYPQDDSNWSHLSGLTLADPNYTNPSAIDILIGADIFYDILINGRKRGTEGSPTAVNSTLGWLVAGNTNKSTQAVVNVVCTNHADVNLEKQLQKFWEIESTPHKKVLTLEEQLCEAHFADTHTRDTSGRFVVSIPWKKPTPPIGNTMEMCLRRFHGLEKRLAVQPKIKQQYIEFMRDYEAQGHMKEINKENLPDGCSFIPHHFVTKDSSTTTKLRVVFDASALSSSKQSLNCTMMNGPIVQDALTDILMRFRLHIVGFTADIKQMYRQILVAEEDTYKQLIYWRESPAQPIQVYKLLTVTYGTKVAPYLATRVLKEISDTGAPKYTLGADAVGNSMYVDDLMDGEDSTLQAIITQQQTSTLLQTAGMYICKWTSNDKEFLRNIPEDQLELNSLTSIDMGQTVKTLGICWNTTTDSFQFTVDMQDEVNHTKRSILSFIAKIYDPLGWLAPVLINSKIFMQSLWQEKASWDSSLPARICEKWTQFKSEFADISKITIPRCIKKPNPYFVALAGFCDASEKAYAANVYLCCYYHDIPSEIILVIAKTRVAPLKTLTLPRLELCGAVLLCQLINTVSNALKLPVQAIRAWSDSTVALCWIQSHPSRWKQFVSHRVAEIQENVPADCWRHVVSGENPADCASRGISTEELKNHDLWWHGPAWLQNIDNVTQPLTMVNNQQTTEPAQVEARNVAFTNLVYTPDYSILSKFSSFSKLIRVTGWILRFYHNSRCRKTMTPQISGMLNTGESRNAQTIWILRTQQDGFHDEIHKLQNQLQIHCKSKILQLNPFLDNYGQLRVGGRITNAPVTPDMKNPILLPRKHPFTQLLIAERHIQLLHAGAQLLYSSLQQLYWIPRGRDTCRQYVRTCVICCRHKAKTMQTIMGNLPASRVTPCRPFEKCGVDYAGPFTTKAIPSKSKVTFKSYLCVFVCFTTHAVHLEVVSSLTSKAFLATLQRFIARRGLPTDIYSDNGTNFVGANRELKETYNFISANQAEIKIPLSKQQINFHFSPAGAPHFGGLWESAVKSVKYHMYRIVGNVRLTFEELTTVMCQIEACLNSRPITPLSPDPNDLEALTPGHFLIGQPLTATPQHDYTDVKEGRLERWQLVTQLSQHFWKRWVNEYLTTLQHRSKWMKRQGTIDVNDMVLVQHENLGPLHWRLGRVVKIHPGKDNIVRVVTVRTKDGEIDRPIVKLCHLPIEY